MTRSPIRGATALLAVASSAGAVRAHGVGGGGGTVGFTAVVGLAVAAGVVAGLTAGVRGGSAGTCGWPGRVVGPGLAVLGVLAAVTALTRFPVVGTGCLLAGAAVTAAVFRRQHAPGGGRAACARATLGAVTAHRVVEGVSLAAVYATGSALGLAGAAILAGHATAETAAVGGLFGAVSRTRAALAVGVVQAGFLAGAVGGLAGTTGLPPVPTNGVVALAGGTLLVVGAAETRGYSPDRP